MDHHPVTSMGIVYLKNDREYSESSSYGSFVSVVDNLEINGSESERSESDESQDT